jgi:hypothetical protein
MLRPFISERSITANPRVPGAPAFASLTILAGALSFALLVFAKGGNSMICPSYSFLRSAARVPSAER